MQIAVLKCTLKKMYKHFLKKHWWKILLAILLVSIGALLYVNATKQSFSHLELSKAQDALSYGVTIEDESAGFFPLSGKEEDGRDNNEDPYPLPFVDFKSITLGADDQYLYIKEEFYGEFPKTANELPIFDNDKIRGMSIALNINTDNNQSTGSPDDEGAEALLAGGVYYNTNPPSVRHYFFTDPTGIQWPEDQRWKSHHEEGLVFGGPGYTYIIHAYPLEELGITENQEITISVASETESDKYHHAAYDPVQIGNESGKMPSKIKIKLGNAMVTPSTSSE